MSEYDKRKKITKPAYLNQKWLLEQWGEVNFKKILLAFDRCLNTSPIYNYITARLLFLKVE